MEIFGIMLASVGLILLVSSRSIYRSGVKAVKNYEDQPKDNKSYLMLIGSGMLVLKIVGGLMLLLGILILILSFI
ncbi:MAG: hypothetical protein CVU95_14985 [Firmicutes bacterium HGW-Firmicutes-2]|jgi:hypothetical protein|nr:MAG: hypothetical protein CVU98_08650 [Firmicutes bacterium HGW-Firmicutes-3]PKM65629.1 MAG: hypothetical protein CVU95_14985 [Firmicutes bacterium HGW-Firmicutes-2]